MKVVDRTEGSNVLRRDLVALSIYFSFGIASGNVRNGTMLGQAGGHHISVRKGESVRKSWMECIGSYPNRCKIKAAGVGFDDNGIGNWKSSYTRWNLSVNVTVTKRRAYIQLRA